jgi:hypothetical protein
MADRRQRRLARHWLSPSTALWSFSDKLSADERLEMTYSGLAEAVV